VSGLLVVLALVGPVSAGNGKDQGAGGSTAGNNLSFPVIYAEGVPKTLRGIYAAPVFDGAFWYYWKLPVVAAEIPPVPVHGACPADPDDTLYCADGIEGTVGPLPDPTAVVVYPQQDEFNEWQAEQIDWSAAPVDVHWIDWGDALEAVDWDLLSQVRAEIVLTQDSTEPMVEFEMKHLSGLGIDEMWGTTGIDLDGSIATIYSPCARFTIQRLLLERGHPDLDALVWVTSEGWSGEGLINAPIFNMAIYQSGQEEDPDAYNAEINIKGKIIYGYTWNVRDRNEGAGDYRMTFSFDEQCPIADDPETTDIDESQLAILNTFFTDGITEIVPLEEEEVPEEPVITEGDETNNPTGGAVPVIGFANNLTYADVRIDPKISGGGGGGPRR